MRTAAALLVLLLTVLAAGTPARAADIETRRLDICHAVEGRLRCAPAGPTNTSLREAPEYLLLRDVVLAPAAVRSDRPLMVVLIAMASSEVRWNGVLIGRNGRPGPDAAREIPGRFTVTYVVPRELVRPGVNRVTARISSHHLPLPVVNAVHLFEVADYQDPVRIGLMTYLPALLMIGVLIVAGVYFTVTSVLDRAEEGAGLLAAAAWLAVAQLGVETARVFVDYPYPWHVVRVAAIALLSAATAVTVAAWTAGRLRTPWPRAVTAATALAAAAALLLRPGYDDKAGWALAAGMLAIGLCGADAVRRRAPQGWIAMAAAAGAAVIWVWQGNRFLDGAWYLMVAAGLGLLVALQVRALSRARAGQGAEAARADEAEARLARRDASVAAVRDGAKTHLVAVADIVALKAADDYCEVRLADGRNLLSTEALAQVLAELPGDFVRVHKSWAVNAAHVRAVGPRPGGRRALTLSDASQVPVGRTHADAVKRFMASAA